MVVDNNRKMIEIVVLEAVNKAVREFYGLNLTLSLQKTKKEFVGDLTVVIFPLAKVPGKTLVQIGDEIGNEVMKNVNEVESFNLIKGFLNFVIKNDYWLGFVGEKYNANGFGFVACDKTKTVLVEYSSPNTNKPLHLGHIRNNLLGYSVSEILKANGNNVIKVNLVNDRGIHICKSMLAWQLWGNGETPENSGMKGDLLVGKYYVLFDQHYKEEIREAIEGGMDKEIAEKEVPLIKAAQSMLKKWEDGDGDVRALWEMMNGWVYAGFDITYKRLGVDFDKMYYESETYLLGKSIVEKGLASGALYKRDNGSVWCDLREDGLDEKLLLRSDGTSVYMTQDLGTAELRHEQFKPEKMIYVVGNEQNYHFDVLKLVLKKMAFDWSKSIYHLSYGMVELPSGKMKSREGTVVDADDLMQEMFETAKQKSEELGKIAEFDNEERNDLYHKLGMAALKYFILKVDPKKNMLFNPQESIDFAGNTGPFIQYTYTRIRSILRRAEYNHCNINVNISLHEKEKELIKWIYDFPNAVKEAGDSMSPAVIANYVYELARLYNQFYQELSVLKEENKEVRELRLAISEFTSQVLKSGMALLGIEMPERM